MKKEPPKRRKSEETKAVILAAAKEEFAATGYEAATIRTIATRAKIDPAMVMRYFGNKEGLFSAAAEFDLQLPDFARVPKSQLGQALVRHFLNRWEADDTLMALLRASVSNDGAARRLKQIFATQLAPALAKARGEDVPAIAPRAGLIATQTLGLALCRYVLKLPPVVSMQHDELVRRVGATVQSYLFD